VVDFPTFAASRPARAHSAAAAARPRRDLADDDNSCSNAPNLLHREDIAMTRMVKCSKLGETLPGLPYKPFNDQLGQRIYESISANAWTQWIEFSKKIVNEYRLDLTQKQAHDTLKEQCEQFLFGQEAMTAPPGYVPEKH
jgi:Fe-S cluster biosynthesis and repair protein YggX